jgi:pilus assembly protein CpaF
VDFVDDEIRLNPLYRFKELEEINGRINGQWEKVGDLENKEKLLASGLSIG